LDTRNTAENSFHRQRKYDIDVVNRQVIFEISVKRISTVRLIKSSFNSCLFVVVLILTGCSSARLLMPTPNVHLNPERDYFAGLTPELKSSEVPLLYITDRGPEQDEAGNLRYGYERSESLAFGTAVVDLGADTTWEKLVEASRTQRRLKPVKLELRDLKEVGRGPNAPLPFREVGNRIVEEPGLVAQRAQAREAFHRVMARQLKLTPRKEVFIYVHGYHNQFEDGAFAMAELWHFMGRIGVPIVYSWPAGYPGLFGYTYDRESSEFTVYHLRRVLDLIAGFPEVEKVHLIAHSRGTDVVLDAVRELTIAARAAGVDPRKKFKIDNLILAAPDLDLQVATQRIVGDQISLSVNRFTVYTSPNDGAIGIASRLFASPRGRLGSFGVDDLGDIARTTLEYSTSNFALVVYSGASGTTASQGDRFGHAYFRNAPTVASDVVLTLRDDIDAGAPGRPLEPIGPHFWAVPPNYPGL
jgi:esterase/lipase superfamily enzyme